MDKRDELLLMMLAEECAEVIQLVSKIYRFGLESYHPSDPEKVSNLILLQNELGDVNAIVHLLNESGVVNNGYIDLNRIAKLRKLSEFGIRSGK